MPRAPEADRPPPYEVQKARLEAYGHAKSSFDATRITEYTTANGWHLDDYQQPLPAEPPGPPVSRGSFAAACNVLRNYSFPPPDLITGIFSPDAPLQGRVMALRGRFLFFTFWFGVRVGEVIDEVRTLPDGAQEAMWGYNYRTLEGHFEQGQIEFTVHKHLASGQVTFRIHAVSKTGHIRNPFYRLGFRLFGRSLQRRFAHQSLQRTLAQVQDMLRSGQGWPPAQEPTPEVVAAADVPERVTEQLDSAATSPPGS